MRLGAWGLGFGDWLARLVARGLGFSNQLRTIVVRCIKLAKWHPAAACQVAEWGWRSGGHGLESCSAYELFFSRSQKISKFFGGLVTGTAN